jgi:hypothetical protein
MNPIRVSQTVLFAGSLALLLAGCSGEKPAAEQNASTDVPPPGAVPPAGVVPPGEVPVPPADEPKSIYGKAIRRAEDVSSLVSQKAGLSAEALAKSASEAAEAIGRIGREQVAPWLEQQKSLWAQRQDQLLAAARQRGIEAEPSVRAALQRLSEAKAAAEAKAREMRDALESDLPRLRQELSDAWERLHEAESDVQETIDTTA